MTTKNNSMNFENTASLLAVSSELFSKNDIITLPSNVKFDYQDVVTVMLHTVTSSTNSLESASNDLIFKNSTQKIPSADTIFEYIKYNNVEDILHKFRNISFRREGLLSILWQCMTKRKGMFYLQQIKKYCQVRNL